MLNMLIVGIALGLWDMDEVRPFWPAGLLMCSILAKMVPTDASHVGEALVVKWGEEKKWLILLLPGEC